LYYHINVDPTWQREPLVVRSGVAKPRSAKSVDLSRRVQALFGKRLKAARRAANPPVEQSVLADALGITRTSVSNIENGRHRVALDQVYAAARVLQVPIDNLLPSIEEAFASEVRFSSSSTLTAHTTQAVRDIVGRVYATREADLEKGLSSHAVGRPRGRKK
jgi:transcriptional regulator with XRE-family HTH domain